MDTRRPDMKDRRREHASGGVRCEEMPKPKPRTWDVYRIDIVSTPCNVGPGIAVYSNYETRTFAGTIEETTKKRALAKARKLYREKATEHFTVIPRGGRSD